MKQLPVTVDWVQDLICFELQGAPNIPLTTFVGSDLVLLGNLHIYHSNSFNWLLQLFRKLLFSIKY